MNREGHLARALALPLALAVAPVLPSGAAAAERYDHQGSLCAVLAPGAGFAVSSNLAAVPVPGGRWVATLGGGAALDEYGRELLLLARASGRGGALDVTALVGFRAYFGYDRVKTFADVQLAVPLAPVLFAGPRIAGGLQYELSPVAGAFCAAGVMLGARPGALLIAGDLSCGVQLRTYLLE